MAYQQGNFQQGFMDVPQDGGHMGGGLHQTTLSFGGQQQQQQPGGDQGGYPSPSQGGAGAGDKVATSITPVTCHQIHTADKLSGETFKIGGKTVYQVSLFVRLNGWSPSPTGREVILSVSDGTGTLNVTMFGTTFIDALTAWTNAPVGQKQYFLRLHGHIRTWNKESCVIAFHAQFVDTATAMAQQLHHYNSCVHAALYAKYGALDDLSPPQTQQTATQQAPQQQLQQAAGYPQQQMQQQQMYGQQPMQPGYGATFQQQPAFGGRY